mgnify:CR=1 FL=1|jgi:hypothetical protein
MPQSIYVIFQNEVIEDHYHAAVQEALTPEGAQEWVRATVERHNLLLAAKAIGDGAVRAWSQENPAPVEEPCPILTKWPVGITKKDPRYAEFRALRDQEEALGRAWSDRRVAAWADQRERKLAVFKAAVAHLGPFTETEYSTMSSFMMPMGDNSFFIREWKTVD